MNRVAFFPGSFDPFTNGHADIVMRGLRLFDEVVIGIGTNAAKKRYFSVETMVSLIEKAFVDMPHIKVIVYDDLTANVAKEHDANFILRGLRNTTDFEYENTISQVNRHLVPEMETIFLITSPEFAPISSTIVRELHKYGADVSDYLPYSLEGVHAG